MSTFQRIIKYLAMAFGIFLSINIIACIVFGITMLFGIITGFDFQDNNKQEISFVQEYINIDNLDIDLTNTKLNIKKGDTLKVEAYGKSNKFEVRQDNNKLYVKDDNKSWFNNQKVLEITIYIPEDLILNKAEIELDINTANIEILNANDLIIDLGVGEFNLSNIKAKKANIKTGVGKTDITDSNLNNLTLDTGVGKTLIRGEIIGDCIIKSGIGRIDLEIIGNKEDYKISTEMGIGNITIDNQKSSDGAIWGNGKNFIKVDGGIGETNIKFL